MHKVIALIVTLNTKEIEARYFKNEIEKYNDECALLDVSLRKYSTLPKDVKVTNEEIAKAANSSMDIVASMERGDAIGVMAAGGSNVVKAFWDAGEINAVVGFGGSAGLVLSSAIMKNIPFGVPKLIITTETKIAGSYIGPRDIVIFPSITDFAGGNSLNRIEAKTLASAAAAISAMAESRIPLPPKDTPAVVASQFGVTTAHVQMAKDDLEKKGYEVLSFHAVGTGGQSLEELVRGGEISGVLDVTTHELADRLVGGEYDPGPNRLEAAGEKGVPQVILPGALDMVNFFDPKKVPQQFSKRRFYYHDPTTTLMRTNKEESLELGKIVAEKVNRSRGPTVILIPMKGFSEYDRRGGVETVDYFGEETHQPWYDLEADMAFLSSLKAHIDRSKSNVEIMEVDHHINEPTTALLSASILEDMMKGDWCKGKKYSLENMV